MMIVKEINVLDDQVHARFLVKCIDVDDALKFVEIMHEYGAYVEGMEMYGVLTCIEKTTKKISPTNDVLEEKTIIIQGETLEECKKIFNEVNKE